MSTNNRSSSSNKNTNSTSDNNKNNNSIDSSTNEDNLHNNEEEQQEEEGVSYLLDQPSYCGHKLKLTTEYLSPVCRRYTLEPQSPEYSTFYGLLTLIDLIIIVFAIGSKLPSLLQISTPSTTTISHTHINAESPPQPFDFNLLLSFDYLFNLIFRQNLLLSSLMFLLLIRVLYRVFIARVPAERLTVIRGVGIQLSKQTLFGGWGAAELVDVATITSFVVHEAYLRHRVVYFLAASCQDRPTLVLPFANTLPRLSVLRVILRGASGILYVKYQQQQQSKTKDEDDSNNTNNKNTSTTAAGGATGGKLSKKDSGDSGNIILENNNNNSKNENGSGKNNSILNEKSEMNSKNNTMGDINNNNKNEEEEDEENNNNNSHNNTYRNRRAHVGRRGATLAEIEIAERNAALVKKKMTINNSVDSK